MLASSLLAAACGSSQPPGPGIAAVAPASADPEAARTALAKGAVFHDRYARRTLYTWTTNEQIEDLARTRRLLTREDSPIYGAAYSDVVLYTLAQRDDLGKLLYSTGFAKARHAWPAPWATRAGWPDEFYGDQLIEIVLRPEGIIVALSTAVGFFGAQTVAGDAVPLTEVRAHPERIAAIYFVSDATRSPAPNIPAPRATYREYIVCNEAMIEAWSVGSDAIRRELDDEAYALEALVRYLRAGTPPAHAATTSAAWATTTPLADPETAYAAALALDSPTYRLDPDALAGLAQILRAAPRTLAIEGRGTTTFALGTARATPRTVPATAWTYAPYTPSRP